MESGTTVFLNGASSSGKTSIAKALQEAMSEPYVHVGLDAFFDMVPTRYVVGEDPWTVTEAVGRMISGFHGAIVALVKAGNNVIVDHVLQETAWVRECAALLAPYRAVLVGVHCPLGELERREAARTDRSMGLAEFQFARVHAHLLYDLEVDTSTQSPEECAGRISAYLHGGHVPTAFHRLRDSLGVDGTPGRA
jgi:chloramphenicol 3-O phosphotransferase